MVNLSDVRQYNSCILNLAAQIIAFLRGIVFVDCRKSGVSHTSHPESKV